MEYFIGRDNNKHPYSNSCKSCVHFDTKKSTKDEETAIIFTKAYEEKIFLCRITHLFITESGKLPAVEDCFGYRKDKFLSVMREIIRKDEEEKNGI
jgi:hypothetical protein